MDLIQLNKRIKNQIQVFILLYNKEALKAIITTALFQIVSIFINKSQKIKLMVLMEQLFIKIQPSL